MFFYYIFTTYLHVYLVYMFICYFRVYGKILQIYLLVEIDELFNAWFAESPIPNFRLNFWLSNQIRSIEKNMAQSH